ncbi:MULTISPECIES: NAD(P)/FAD-dependent oxidoreductase [unclassified Saccharopolyspora]|uniref:NAD(P)/FAD-dependent oxidoreductase n=1 Tax=unclassified Saccharopolyspora TaxID=2646250 RepID=UPI001CD36224|nr:MULTISPECIES: NAD(P)/FAD-dependent oxidoreductase [unclassified Saccharopolyspora]MCA1228986.1 NAD(P)/FAD-dependent oxidoreductase [Saccharopolyspora sp. 6M]MCA1282809.1 NAD(P)/FAD-dependent oxidoreductase [Saccharopolyspora sp. 7B]
MDLQDRSYEIVVVGGGAAGTSAALSCARARRSVLVVDAGEPRNAPAEGVHNYLGREGTPPGELVAAGRAEAERYGAEFSTGEVVAAERAPGGGFRLTLAGGAAVVAARLVVATGLVDELPPVPGLAQRWGREVLHCPYCHGWEVRDRHIAVLGTGPMALHQALLWRQWSSRVTLLRHALGELGAEDRANLDARGITVVPGPVEGVRVEEDRFTGVEVGGRLLACDALVVAPLFTARLGALADLGLRTEPVRRGDVLVGTRLPVDATGATAVPGVWAAGNVTDLTGNVIGAAAAGANVAAQVNSDLVEADIRRARDDPFVVREREVADLVAGERRHGL